MKQTLLSGLTLTLMTLLLVMVAAFIFLFQGRQALQQRAVASEEELLQTRSELATSEARSTAGAAALATAESNSVLLEGQLVESQQRVEELATEVAETSSTLTQLQLERQQLLENFPLVTIVSPEDGTVFSPNEQIEFVVAASDAAGITAVDLQIDDETISSFTVNNEDVFAVSVNWSTETEGTYAARATAVNGNGLSGESPPLTIEIIDISTRNAAIRDEIESNVIQLRGLEPLVPPEPTLRTAEELGQQMTANFTDAFPVEEARRDALVLHAFDLLASDVDLQQTLIQLHNEAAVNLYGPETADFVTFERQHELNAVEQWIYVHQVVHALQQQHFNPPPSGNILDAEATLARRALAEGEAQLVQLLFLENGYFSEAQADEIVLHRDNHSASLSAEFPAILVNNLQFPYDAGFDFVFTLYNQGTFTAVDEAWENPPQSSEHILHPERYQEGDEPQPVTLPLATATLGEGWERVGEGIFGEFLLREYLSTQLTDEDIETAATGWGGDRYAVYQQETSQDIVMLLRILWDTPTDSSEFAALYPRYPTTLYNTGSTMQSDGGECWQGEDVICFYQQGSETLIVRAPQVETAVALAATVYGE